MPNIHTFVEEKEERIALKLVDFMKEGSDASDICESVSELRKEIHSSLNEAIVDGLELAKGALGEKDEILANVQHPMDDETYAKKLLAIQRNVIHSHIDQLIKEIKE